MTKQKNIWIINGR